MPSGSHTKDRFAKAAQNAAAAERTIQKQIDGKEPIGGDTPMKRPAQPEEIAPAFVFLAARSCSSYITGEILPIIGGYSGG